MIVSSIEPAQVVDYVTTRWDHLKSQRKYKEEVWMECIRAYLSSFPPVWDARAKSANRSKRYVALPFDAVEDTHSALVDTIFGSSDWPRIVPARPGGLEHDDKGAAQVRALLSQQCYNDGFKRKAAQMFKVLCMVGNCPYSVNWRTERAVDYPAYRLAMQDWQERHQDRWIEYNVAMNQWRQTAMAAEQLGQMPPPKPSIIMPEPPPANTKFAYAGPSLEIGDIFNYVEDPFSPDPHHKIRIKRSYVSMSILRAMAQKNSNGYSVYENIDEISAHDRRRFQQDDYLEERYEAYGMDVPDVNAVEILEMWGSMEIPGNQDVRYFPAFVATIANGQHLIRFEPTFLWTGDSPVQNATYRDVPGMVYGVGQLEMALGLADLINVRANQNVDVVAFATNPEYKAVDDGVIDLQQTSAPGRVRLVNDLANLQVLEKDLRGLQISMQDVALLKAEFQQITKSGSGRANFPRESATSSALGANQDGMDLTKIAMHIEDTAIAKILSLWTEMDAQYLDKKVVVKGLQVGDEVITEVSPETLRMGWFIRCDGSRYESDREQRFNRVAMLFQLLAGNQLTFPLMDIPAWGKRLAQEANIPNADELFNDRQRAEQILQDMIQFGFAGTAPGQNGGAGGTRTDAASVASGAA